MAQKFLIFCFIFFGFSIVSIAQSKKLDERIVGRWIHLFSKDGMGELVVDDFSGKNYVWTYTKSGKLILDPQFLKDDLKRNGINEPLDYSAIPTLTWTTFDDEEIEIGSNYGDSRERYFFSGDTLITVNQKGYITYLLKADK